MFKIVKAVLKFWFSLKVPIRFVLVGGYNVVFGYLLFSVLYFYIQHEQISLFIASFIGIMNNFLSFKIFVFDTKRNWLQECLKTYISYGGIYLLNVIMLYVLVRHMQINTYIAQLICVTTLPILTYFILRRFSFKKI